MEKLLGGAVSSGSSGTDTLLAMGAMAPNSELFGNKCCNLTVKQRAVGFGICFLLGVIISFCSTMTIGNPTQFGILYSLGNMIALFSTAFLVGPKRQCANMFHKKRVIATAVYLIALVGTLAVAIGTQSTIGTLAMLVVQFIALVWYTLSYIPYARTAAAKLMSRWVGVGAG
jgi:hypothetical protein